MDNTGANKTVIINNAMLCKPGVYCKQNIVASDVTAGAGPTVQTAMGHTGFH